jgi:hypothetical protein
MKMRKMYLIAVVIVLVLCSSMGTTPSRAAIVWQDDFDDGNLDGWTVFGYESPYSDVMVGGNFSAASGRLEVSHDDPNFARRNSTVTEGTWSFDMYVPNVADERGAMYVYIMSNGSRPIPEYPADFIGVGAWRQSASDSWHFIVWSLKGFDSVIHSSIDRDPMQGWHHIDISRTSEGQFSFYVNGTLEDEFTYNGVTTSMYLEFYCYSVTGAAIDNLVVDDDPDKPKPPPLPLELIALGAGSVVAVIVIVIVLRRRR